MVRHGREGKIVSRVAVGKVGRGFGILGWSCVFGVSWVRRGKGRDVGERPPKRGRWGGTS